MSILVGKKAPDFTCPAALGNGELTGEFNLAETIKGKYAVVFFYPLDFTFVCPSELIAMDVRMEEFKKLGVEVIGVSIDSHFTHNAWKNTPINEGGIGPVKYTLAADLDHSIAQNYGILTGDDLSGYPAGTAMRASFIIDQEGVVRSQVVNDEPIGRNMDELIRIIEGYQFFKEHGQVCPAGWTKGKAAMTPGVEGVAAYLKDHASEL